MQSILPDSTSLTTFGIVLPAVTVSTLLAVFVVTGSASDMQKTISKNIPNPVEKLHELMLKHPSKRLGKKQLLDSKLPIWRRAEQRSFWTYLTFLAEFCFISLPVHEVKRAIDLYGLRTRHRAPS